MEKSSNKSSEYKVDFSGLILGFCSAALAYMGLGSEKRAEKNKSLAEQNIDIIELLHVKTQGNLSAEEKQLLEQVLTDLKLKFAEAFKKA